MKFVKWIFLIFLFAFAEAAPTTIEQPSYDPNYTKVLNDVVSFVFNSPLLERKKPFDPSKDEYLGQQLKTQSKHGKLYNVFLKHSRFKNEKGFTKAVIAFEDSGTLKISVHRESSIIEAYLQDSNHHIETEKFTLICVLKITTRDEFSTDCSSFDRNEIKLLPSDYQYKPDEEMQIKNEIENYIKEATNVLFTETNKVEFRIVKYILLQIFDQLLNNKQERYYSISTIPSTNYTLNKVTIYGLWNLQSVSYDTSYLAATPMMEMGAIRSYMVQNTPSSSDELSFKADNIYISFDQKLSKVQVKIEAYSVVNTKLNTSLSSDESKFIIGELESAFAASIQSAWKNSGQHRLWSGN